MSRRTRSSGGRCRSGWSIRHATSSGFRPSRKTQDLLSIYRTIREFCPQARLVVSLSPIPLVPTFRPVSALTANAVSKAVLRASIDETLAVIGEDGVLQYWPSYDIDVERFGTGRWWDDRRHILPEVIFNIMRLFEDAYCTGGSSERSVFRTLGEASGDGRTAGGVPPSD